MNWIRLAALFVFELVKGAISVAWLVVSPRRLRPAIIAYPLTVTSDAQITLLANMITMTPGTLSLDVSTDRKRLLIHAIDVGDREHLVGDVASGFETRVLRALK